MTKPSTRTVALTNAAWNQVRLRMLRLSTGEGESMSSTILGKQPYQFIAGSFANARVRTRATAGCSEGFASRT